MGKLKTIAKLAKLNNKLGLLDAGDIVGLASTAYKVKNFSPTDHLPDFELDFWEREEIEKNQRRNAILAAAAIGAGAYLLTKNRDKVADLADEARKKGKKIALEAKEKGEDLAEDAADKGKEVAKDIEDKVEDVSNDVADKANKASKTVEKTEVKNNFYNK